MPSMAHHLCFWNSTARMVLNSWKDITAEEHLQLPELERACKVTGRGLGLDATSPLRNCQWDQERSTDLGSSLPKWKEDQLNLMIWICHDRSSKNSPTLSLAKFLQAIKKPTRTRPTCNLHHNKELLHFHQSLLGHVEDILSASAFGKVAQEEKSARSELEVSQSLKPLCKLRFAYLLICLCECVRHD